MPIVSPCTKVCTIDPRSGLCRGCGRTLGEITQWASLGDGERKRVMGELSHRLEINGLSTRANQPRRAEG